LRDKLTAQGFKNVRTPEVIVPHWVRGEASFEVLAPYPQKMVTLAIGGSIGTPEEGLSAPIVMVQDVPALQALKREQVEGKIVYFAGRTERTRDGSGYGKAVRSRQEGPSAAAALGAVGIVIRSIGTSINRIAHTGTLTYNIGAPRIPAVAISNPDANLLERVVASGKPVSVRLRVTARDLPQVRSANVIGDLPGTDLANEIVLVGGHLDSWDPGFGVQDDGAGVIIALAAAKLAASMEPKPRRTIRVALWAGEEQGLFGSRAYVKQHFGNPRDPAVGAKPAYEKLSAYFNQDYGAGQYRGIMLQGNEYARAQFTTWMAPFRDLGMTVVSNQSLGSTDHVAFDEVGLPGFQFLQDNIPGTGGHTNLDFLEAIQPSDLMKNAVIMASFAYHAANASARIPRKTVR